MRRLKWERYYPEVTDNQKKRRAGEPAVSVMLLPPSSLLWREFMLAVAKDPDMKLQIIEKLTETRGNIERAAGPILKAAILKDHLAELLYLPCVGDFENFILDDGEEIKNGTQHWLLRREIDGPDWYTDILNALIDRAHLEKGLDVFLASASGLLDSDQTDLVPVGAQEPSATSSPS